MFAFTLIDTTEVDIRALVTHEINRAVFHGSESTNQLNWFSSLFGNMTDTVLIVEFLLLLVTLGILIQSVIKMRGKGKKPKKIVSARKASNLQSIISPSDIERILNNLSKEKAVSLRGEVTADKMATNYQSIDALREVARAKHVETGRLNFAISYASQASRLKDSRFKEAFALVTEGSDLDVIARQLNMGKGELELILALKKSKIASLRKEIPKRLERSSL